MIEYTADQIWTAFDLLVVAPLHVVAEAHTGKFT